jgi:hypothetical protein
MVPLDSGNAGASCRLVLKIVILTIEGPGMVVKGY